MNTGNAFWTAGVSCLYLSFLRLFLGYSQADPLFAVTVLFLGLSVYISGMLRKTGKPIGILLLLIPVVAASGMIAGTENLLIPVFPVIVYGIYMIMAGAEKAVYWEKIRTFKVLAVVLAVEVFAGLVMEKELTVVMAYVVAYLLFSVMALNLFRYGKAIDGTGRMLYVSHLGFFVVVCGACAGLVSFIGRMGGRILEILLTPFAYLLAGLVSLGSGVTQLLRNEAEKMIEQGTTIEEQVEQVQQGQQMEQSISNAADATWLDSLLKVAPAILLVLVFVYVAYWIYRLWKERYVYREDDVKTTETYEKVGRKGFGRIKLFKTNREKIRKEYAKYMRSVRVQGCRIGKSSTSLDICNEAKMRLNHDATADERIRELYMKARYSEDAVSDEEVREIRQLV